MQCSFLLVVICVIWQGVLRWVCLSFFRFTVLGQLPFHFPTHGRCLWRMLVADRAEPHNATLPSFQLPVVFPQDYSWFRVFIHAFLRESNGTWGARWALCARCAQSSYGEPASAVVAGITTEEGVFALEYHRGGDSEILRTWRFVKPGLSNVASHATNPKLLLNCAVRDIVCRVILWYVRYATKAPL